MTKKKDALAERKHRLQEALNQVDAQLKDIHARERKQARKDDTRRKIIMGALCESHMNANPNSELAQVMKRLLNEYVVTDKERALFKLPPLPPAKQDNRKQEQRYQKIKRGL